MAWDDGPGATIAMWLELALPSLPESAEIGRIAVAVLAGGLPFTLAEIDQLKVAVDEAIGNCVLHAYPDAPGRVRLRAHLEGMAAIQVEVQDWGCGIADIAQARQPAFTTSTDPDHSGLGFAFMEQFTDALEVESEPGRGTLVRMRKQPQAVANAAERQ